METPAPETEAPARETPSAEDFLFGNDLPDSHIPGLPGHRGQYLHGEGQPDHDGLVRTGGCSCIIKLYVFLCKLGQKSVVKSFSVPKPVALAVKGDSRHQQLLFDRTGLKLLGVHIIGDYATDLIHIGQTVMAFEGGIDFFINNVFNYPTYSECYRVAALNGVNRL